MERYIRGRIEKIVQSIMLEYGITAPIEDMYGVAEKLGGRIEQVDGFDEVFGVELRDDGFVIRIPREVSRAYSRVNIAQGLGALFMHEGYGLGPEFDRAYLVNDTKKVADLKFECDEFAVNFLMPRKAYLDFVYTHMEGGAIDTFAIANHFGVSNGLAINRGKWLEVLQW